MTNAQILEKLASIKKGKFISLKKKKDLGQGVEKVSDLVIRLGVDYSKMACAQGKEVGSLPWGHWVEGLEGLVIEHTKTDKKTGIQVTKNYLRVASSYSNTTRSYYYLNGKEISKQEAIDIIGEKKMATSNPDVYNIEFSNILELGGE